MAWEIRSPSGPKYFYLSRRGPGGRVVKTYFGKGSGAQSAADLVAWARARRDAPRQELASARARLEAVDGAMAALEGDAGVLFEALLLSEGYHRPNYGPWRKRRGTG